jgi:hypothetical protein
MLQECFEHFSCKVTFRKSQPAALFSVEGLGLKRVQQNMLLLWSLPFPCKVGLEKCDDFSSKLPFTRH